MISKWSIFCPQFVAGSFPLHSLVSRNNKKNIYNSLESLEREQLRIDHRNTTEES